MSGKRKKSEEPSVALFGIVRGKHDGSLHQAVSVRLPASVVEEYAVERSAEDGLGMARAQVEAWAYGEG